MTWLLWALMMLPMLIVLVISSGDAAGVLG
jgi:hypothetical protein